MHKASMLQLVRQGLWLHYASFYGPLRASRNFRRENADWFMLVLSRWWREYGLNLLLFLTVQPLVFLYSETILSAVIFEVLALAGLPILTVLQMVLDSFRSDVQVYYDTESRTGLTVRRYWTTDNQLTWAYYNHYALPIGHKRGVNIRKSLHLEAESRKVRLVCHAQSELVADYYEHEEHATRAVRFDQQKPFLLWEYSDSGVNKYEDLVPQKSHHSLMSRLFGVHNIRNSGSAPMVFAV